MTSQNTPPSSSEVSEEMIEAGVEAALAHIAPRDGEVDVSDWFTRVLVREVVIVGAETVLAMKAKDTPQGDEAAWREGYATGMTAGGLVNIDEDWLTSDTRAALVRSKPEGMRPKGTRT